MISFGPSFGNIIKQYQLSPHLKDKDQVFLLLGGNIGNVRETFAKALNLISDFGRVVKTSRLYSTEAWGMDDADNFINQALLITTDLRPMALLEKLKGIEQKLGRTSKTQINNNYESRSLDIDILLWGDLVIDSEHLIVPHPRMHLRNFTLIPLAELAPEFKHPVLGNTIGNLLKASSDQLKVTDV